MAICEFAEWMEISGDVGRYKSNPFKIVHHTTEGTSASGAFNAYKKNRSDPHFTVDDNKIYQHIDTERSARSLRNKGEPKEIETNRDSAIQIELVGFARLQKSRESLVNLARLLRWIELLHSVPKDWPNGFPKVATSKGKDPGGHNRDANTWDTVAGHYGHCHVPKNTHWDPGYTAIEVKFLMDASFDEYGALANGPELPEISAFDAIVIQSSDPIDIYTDMPDHAVVNPDEY